MSATPGVTDYVAGADWRGVNAARFGAHPHTARATVSPPFSGHPQGVLAAGLQPPLDDLADTDEAPPQTLADTVSDLAADVAELQAMAHQHDDGSM